MNAYWCRWYEPKGSTFESQGPKDKLLSWLSGYDGEDNGIFVGLVWAKNEADAKRIIESRCQVLRWSFVYPTFAFPSESGRFPAKDPEVIRVWQKRWPAGFAALPTGEEVDRG